MEFILIHICILQKKDINAENVARSKKCWPPPGDFFLIIHKATSIDDELVHTFVHTHNTYVKTNLGKVGPKFGYKLT
jgi:hypothetical protein